MFYVLYSPSKKLYLDENGEFVKFTEAERFNNCQGVVEDKVLENSKIYVEDVRWVGPCEEDGEP